MRLSKKQSLSQHKFKQKKLKKTKEEIKQKRQIIKYRVCKKKKEWE